MLTKSHLFNVPSRTSDSVTSMLSSLRLNLGLGCLITLFFWLVFSLDYINSTAFLRLCKSIQRFYSEVLFPYFERSRKY